MKYWSKTTNAPTGRWQQVMLLGALVLCLAACSGGPGEESTDQQDAGADVTADATDADPEADGTEVDGADYVDPRLLEPTKLSAGYGHTCMIRSDQTVTCWGLGWQPDVYEGEGDHDQADPPDGKFVDISAGRFHTCGIRPDLSVECWGIGSDASIEEDPAKYDFDQSITPEGQFIEITAGAGVSCGIRTDSTVRCWGFTRDEPFDDEKFTAISAGWSHLCGVRTDGSVACYGAGVDPLEKVDSIDFDQSVAPDGSYRDVAAGKFHSCALSESGKIDCWGLGSSTDEEGDRGWDFNQALPPEDSFTDISAGSYHTCGVAADSGDIKCWGLGTSSEDEWDRRDFDQGFSKFGEFVTLDAGAMSTCGLDAEGEMTCWGWNGLGQTEPFSRYGTDGCQRTDYSDWARFSCSPFCQTGCAGNSNCIIGSTSALEPATWCEENGTQDEGEDCWGFDKSCSKGLSCDADFEREEAFCREVCRRSEGHDDCPADYRCYTDAGRTAGYCVPEAGD